MQVEGNGVVLRPMAEQKMGIGKRGSGSSKIQEMIRERTKMGQMVLYTVSACLVICGPKQKCRARRDVG